MPVWVRQITTANEQLSQTNTALADRFSTLTIEFDRAREVSRSTSDQATSTGAFPGIDGLFRQNEKELRRVIELLEVTQKDKRQLVAKVRECFTSMKELDKLAEDVSEIARHTNILSLNAMIEAASAGDPGRGFAIVADEVRSLSALSATSGRIIAKTVERISQRMSAVVNLAEESELKEQQALDDSQAAIDRVMSNFEVVTSSLTESAADLQAASGEIHEHIGEVMVSLQFQDRVSQILTNVCESVRALYEQFFSRQTKVVDPATKSTEIVDGIDEQILHRRTTTGQPRV